MAKEMKKLKVGKHFQHGTEVAGPKNESMNGAGLGRKGKPHGPHNLQVSGHLNPYAMRHHNSSKPPGAKGL